MVGNSQTHTVATLSLPRKKLKLVSSSTRLGRPTAISTKSQRGCVISKLKNYIGTLCHRSQNHKTLQVSERILSLRLKYSMNMMLTFFIFSAFLKLEVIKNRT